MVFNRLRGIAFALGLLTACALPSMSQIFKQPPVLYPTPDGPATAVVLADVNKDGNTDAIVVDGNLDNPIFSIDGAVSVLLGNGNGTFQPAVTYSAVLRGTDAVAVGDLNGDGWPDLVVVSNDGACLSFYCLGVLLNKGDGTFDAVVGYTTAGFDISSIVISDVNGDGKPDLVFTDLCGTECNNGAVEVLLGNGDGTFGSPTLYNLNRASYPLSVIAVDLNGDGKPDLAVANCTSTGSGIVTVMLNKGDGTFPTQVTYPTGGNLASSVVAADMNRDSKLDLVVANLYSASVGVLLGNSNGTFGKVVVYPAIQDPDSLAIADFNGDGSPDVVVASGNNRGDIFTNVLGNVTVLLNNGNGTLSAPVTMYSTKGNNANSVAVAKLNPDANPDLVIADGCDGYKSDCPSGAVAVFVGMPDRTTTLLTSSANPSNPGQSVTFSATISATEGPIPNGTIVQFLSDTKKIGTGTTLNGVAKFTTSSLTAGTHLIKASYPSSTFFKASNSTLSQVVN
jgi:VCBS repeat protein/Big-like domain-containing protein